MKEIKIERNEKWIRINTIEGYENVRDCYYLSNSDKDIIVNRSTDKRVKGWIDGHGYSMVGLMTKDGKMKTCYLHVLKAKAFIFGPNPLGANVVRHLNDYKTDNRLENLAFGTFSDNIQDSIRNGHYNYEGAIKGLAIGGKITGAKNGIRGAKKLSKSVRCIETGIIYPSCIEAERQTGISHGGISLCCLGKRMRAGGFHWTYVNKEEVNNNDVECE